MRHILRAVLHSSILRTVLREETIVTVSGYLLKEDGFKLLLESGDGLLLEG